MPWVVAAGVALGVAYTLSPLTVLCLAVMVVATRWAGRDLTGHERQWFLALLVMAIALRLIAIAGLFLSADPARPYATFFGDEEIFKSRPMWLRNVGLGVPISAADVIYAFDETGMSGYLYVLAVLQALVGEAPYGVHVFNASLYLTSALLLYRLVRPSFGRHVAFGGLTVLLFFPSLFSWSISALKEPVYMLLATVELLCVIAVARAPGWWRKALALAVIPVLAVSLEGLRKGTLLVAAIGTLGGLAVGLTITRPRLAWVAAVVVPLAMAVALTRPAVQDRIRSTIVASARYHAGHVVTPGVSYKILNPRHYVEWIGISRMPPRELAWYVGDSVTSYFLEPRPAHVESRALWAYLPEQAMWLILAVLAPFGISRGLRSDPVLTCVLLAHGLAVIMMVALTSGNIGTLIRHRGLSLMYTVWLSALGASAIVGWMTARPRLSSEGIHTHAHG